MSLYTVRCTECDWWARANDYAMATERANRHADWCEDASTEIWPVDLLAEVSES